MLARKGCLQPGFRRFAGTETKRDAAGFGSGIGVGKAKVVRWYRTVRPEGVLGVRVMSCSR